MQQRVLPLHWLRFTTYTLKTSKQLLLCWRSHALALPQLRQRTSTAAALRQLAPLQDAQCMPCCSEPWSFMVWCPSWQVYCAANLTHYYDFHNCYYYYYFYNHYYCCYYSIIVVIIMFESPDSNCCMLCNHSCVYAVLLGPGTLWASTVVCCLSCCASMSNLSCNPSRAWL